jgi:hypothetical protein
VPCFGSCQKTVLWPILKWHGPSSSSSAQHHHEGADVLKRGWKPAMSSQRGVRRFSLYWYVWIGMKMVRIFSDPIRNRIRLKGFRSVRIRVRIFNIRYCIRIRILKSHIYDIDIQLYHIRHSWHYSYSNMNPNRNIKINIISVIFVCIWSVFIPTWEDVVFALSFSLQ